ncbi:MAG TPA: hypothetical protein VM099_05090 [Gemmatimonadaceae bacterium]|nr:hypothetical protein [Gemmatimonadaceae bacterium]
MSVFSTSYEFHKTIESPTEFVRREWKAFALFGGGFVVALLIAVIAIDPAYFYSRMATDPLRYYLKGLAFVETGHTAARSAINVAPFTYVAMPGILRAPFMAAFQNFDNQLRAIQMSNVVLIATTATLYAYILTWVIPKNYHRFAIAFSFAFLLLSPEWLANVFLPLADAPYSLFTTACILLVVRLQKLERPLRTQLVVVATALVFFGIAFLTRFTAPLLFVYAAVLGAGRVWHRRPARGIIIGAVICAALVIAVLVALNWRTLPRYTHDVRSYLALSTRTAMFVNLMVVALPSQIIPGFRLAFSFHPIADTFHVVFASSLKDFAFVAAGMSISAVVFLGMWRARNRLMPEIVYTLLALPILAVLMQSTTRYLMAYQPFLWIFFYVGASALLRPLLARVGGKRGAFIGVGLLGLAAAAAVAMRASKFVETVSGSQDAVPVARTGAYVREVVTTYRSLREFLERLPRDKTILISERPNEGRWKVISGFRYYRPDSALSVAVAKHDAYLVSECGTSEVCQQFDSWDGLFRQRFEQYGSFTFEPVFSRITAHAKARVYRVRNLQ